MTALSWQDPDSDPIGDINALRDRLSAPQRQSQLKQLLDLAAENQRKVEEQEQQNKLDMMSSGMGAVYEVNRHDGSCTHVGWIPDHGGLVDLAGDPLDVKFSTTYQTIVVTGPASQGSAPAVVVPGIQRPSNITSNIKSGWSHGGTPVIVSTNNTTTPLPGVPVSSGFKYASATVPASSAQFQAVNTHPTGDSENSNPVELDHEWFGILWSRRDDIRIDPDEYPDGVAHFWFDVIGLPQKIYDEEGNVIESPTVTYWFHSNMSYKAAVMVLLSLQVTSQKVTRLIEVWDFENERSEWVVV